MVELSGFRDSNIGFRLQQACEKAIKSWIHSKGGCSGYHGLTTQASPERLVMTRLLHALSSIVICARIAQQNHAPDPMHVTWGFAMVAAAR
jgi:hypothetical protein